MDVTIDDESCHDALAELAAVASAHASWREDVRAEIDEERVVVDAQQERVRSAWRTVGVVALIVAIAGCAVTIMLTLPKKPHASSAGSTVSAASLATARALGDSAHTRLTAEGAVVTAAACLSAYAADAASSPLLLPSPARRTMVRDRYVAACLSQ